MADSYYDDNRYSARPAAQGPYHPPPPQQTLQQPGAGQYGSQSYYPPDPQQHQRGTYTPPQESYSRGTPPPPNMQVGTYREYDDRSEYGRGYDEPRHHRHHHEHGSSNASYYDEPPRERSYDSLPRDDGRRRGSEKVHVSHSKEKEIGASILGAAVGGLVGHEAGHNKVATLIGVVAGAYGGHKLEEKREDKKEVKRLREKESMGPRHEAGPYSGGGYADQRGIEYGDEGQRRHSRGGRSYSGESSESEEDGDRSRRHHH